MLGRNPSHKQNQFKKIKFNHNTTLSKSTSEVRFARDFSLFGEQKSFSLNIDCNNLCTLIPNYKLLPGKTASISIQKIKPDDSINYIYVILADSKNQLQLRIGLGSHYYLANKVDYVIAAGEIKFQNQKILYVNDKSGGYHIDEKKSNLKKRKFEVSIERALALFGLLEKYVSYKSQEDPQKNTVSQPQSLI